VSVEGSQGVPGAPPISVRGVSGGLGEVWRGSGGGLEGVWRGLEEMSHMPIAVPGLLEGPEMSVTAENGVFWGSVLVLVWEGLPRNPF
jgi:hypothetical protein